MSPELIGFLLVLGAGLCTGIGAAFVFSPRLIKLASRRFLAGSLGFAAGVMLYVSFVEILLKSTEAFQDSGSGDKATLYSTLCFFGGVIFMAGIDVLIHKLEGWNEAKEQHQHSSDDEEEIVDVEKQSAEDGGDGTTTYDVSCACPANTRGSTVDRWVDKAEQELKDEEINNPTSKSCLRNRNRNRSNSTNSKTPSEGLVEGTPPSETVPTPSTYTVSANLCHSHANSQSSHTHDISSTHDKKLVRMGMATALSIAIHNFPEGLATFVAAVDDPSVGATLAIAIAVHNIPEGLCVSIPIYYATGNRKKAFVWGLFSGLTEPIGAALGWLVLGNAMNDVVYGVMFGLVAGMMVRISLKELLPTSYRYDPEDTVVTLCVTLGMLVMAFSLVLFVAV